MNKTLTHTYRLSNFSKVIFFRIKKNVSIMEHVNKILFIVE